MISRIIGLVYPLKRRIWVMNHKGKVYLRKLHRKHLGDGTYKFYVRGRFPYILDFDRVEVWYTSWNGILKNLELAPLYIEAWGEYRPWWRKNPNQESTRIIEFNMEAKPRSELLYKTRTLPQVWEQG